MLTRSNQRKQRTRKPVPRKSQGFSIYISPSLRKCMTQFQQDHPEIALSRVLSNFLAQYLHDQGYRYDERETNP